MPKKIISILFSLIVIILIYNNFFTKSMIVGTYISNGNGLDGANKGDTLIISKDNTFKSKTWGKGKYTLNYSTKGTTIRIQYDYEFGKASYHMGIKRNYYIEPKLIFDYDLDYYFYKIE
jgi:hypothetical protein